MLLYVSRRGAKQWLLQSHLHFFFELGSGFKDIIGRAYRIEAVVSVSGYAEAVNRIYA
jgi:hypothetical protein